MYINQLPDEIRSRRERALARWAAIGHEQPNLGRALDLQRRLVGRQLDLLATLGPVVTAVAPPTETHVLDMLADGFPVLRGGIGPLPVDLLGPVMVDLSRDIAEISGYHAATRRDDRHANDLGARKIVHDSNSCAFSRAKRTTSACVANQTLPRALA